MNERIQIAVVGGGAAGYFAAVTCAEKNPDLRITLYESAAETLAKVRISGGGRCNVTHHCFDPHRLVESYPRGGLELRGPLTRFGPRETVQWFESRGAALKTEPDGRVFPATDDSRTIVNLLKREAEKAGVEVRTRARIEKIEKNGGSFTLHFKDGTHERASKLLLATGGDRRGHAIAHALGHAIEPPVPSLFTFKISDPLLEGLAGISFEKARLHLQSAGGKALEAEGPLLITHWGLSGPAVLKLSAWGARALFESDYQARLRVSWLADLNEEAALKRLVLFKEQNPKRLVRTSKAFELPKRFWEKLVGRAGVPDDLPWSGASGKQLRELARALTQTELQVAGKGEFKEEFVTCGGVRLKEVDFRTMESRVCPGLYFAGEILDVDGLTGGFNFQNAWTTAHLAGCAMAEDRSE